MKLSALAFIAVLTTSSAAFANNNHFGDGSSENTYNKAQTVSINTSQQKVIKTTSKRNYFGDGSIDNKYIVNSVKSQSKRVNSIESYPYKVKKWR